MSITADMYRWFSGRGQGRRRAIEQEDDPADMGTAFGLDMSLLDDVHAVEPEPRRSRADETAPSWKSPFPTGRKPAF